MADELFGVKEKLPEITAEQIREECRPIATRFIKQVALYANNKYRNGATMTAAISLAIAERAVLFCASRVAAADLAKGRGFIENVYDSAKRDILEQWAKQG